MYPNTFYRVSVKALIKDDSGRILVVKENQDTWSLPGGGLDHGEHGHNGIIRELKEELNLKSIKINDIAGVKTFYLDIKQAWLLWVVYEVSTKDAEFVLGEGVTAAKFINHESLKHSSDIFEKLVYEVASGHF